jgi:hypothetical protein
LEETREDSLPLSQISSTQGLSSNLTAANSELWSSHLAAWPSQREKREGSQFEVIPGKVCKTSSQPIKKLSIVVHACHSSYMGSITRIGLIVK